MLVGHITQLEEHTPLLTHPVWNQAFKWVKTNTSQPSGDYEIDSRNLFASIQTIPTIPHSQGKIECHFQYIDIHYCIDGGEIIEWIPVDQLTQPIETNKDKDYALYTPIENLTSLRMTPGTFAIFLPQDAHMPKVSDNINPQVKKIVIKIKYDFINSR